MQRLRLNIGSLRRRKKGKEEESPPGSSSSTVNPKWLEDEEKVREGTCSFQVKYLGCIEVYESRGMQVCEEAVEALRLSRNKHKRALLYVSGDALRVVDELSKGLIVDQTIEKVSFCAPNRNHEKGFAYICREGATRRWMCHAFIAHKESGERLSHAVGCAFALCLERKQKREKEAVQAVYSEERTAFARMGSFRQASLTERLQDPQSAILPPPQPPPSSPSSQAAIPRPRASVSLIERQGSLRLFPKLQTSAHSPFKRNFSLRDSELPSALDRKNLGSDPKLEESEGWKNEDQFDVPQYSSTAPAAALSPLCEEADQQFNSLHLQQQQQQIQQPQSQQQSSPNLRSLNPFISSSPNSDQPLSGPSSPFPSFHPTNPFLQDAWSPPTSAANLAWPVLNVKDAFDTSWTDQEPEKKKEAVAVSGPPLSPSPSPRLGEEGRKSSASTNPFL